MLKLVFMISEANSDFSKVYLDAYTAALGDSFQLFTGCKFTALHSRYLQDRVLVAGAFW
jgi:hypothetical protein